MLKKKYNCFGGEMEAFPILAITLYRENMEQICIILNSEYLETYSAM